MTKCSILFTTLLALYLCYKCFSVITYVDDEVNDIPNDSERDLIDDFENCDQNIHKFLDIKQRIEKVRSFLSNVKSRDVSSRENVVIYGVPGALSELVGAVIGGEPGVFYLPNVLQSRAFYIEHDPTLAIPLTVEILERIFVCDVNDKLLLNHLMQHEAVLDNIQSPLCSSLKEKTDNNTLYVDACRKMFSKRLSRACQQSKVTVLQTDKLRSISYLEVLATDMKSRRFNFRVMHIIRDPRAIVYDILNTSKLSADKLGLMARRMCENIRMDIKIAQSKPIWRHGRYKLIKIEEFVPNLKLTDTAFNKYAVEGIWKVNLSSEVRQIVEDECTKVLRMLGYS